MKLSEKISKISGLIYEYIALAMVILFSALPSFMLVGPGYYGKVFKLISWVEIFMLVVCMVGYLIVFSVMSYSHTFSYALKNLAASLKNYFTGRRYAIMLLAVYILTVISAFAAPNRERALAGTDFRPDGVLMHTAFLALFVFSSALKSPRTRKTVIASYCISFMLVSTVVVQQYFGIIGTAPGADTPQWAEPLKNFYDSIGIRTGHFYKGLTGTFYNLNHMGYYAAVCASVFSVFVIGTKKLWKKIIASIFAAYSFWVVIINNTFGAYIALFVTLCVSGLYLLIKQKRKFSGFIPLVILVVVTILATVIPPKGASQVVINNLKVAVSDAENIYKQSEDSQNAGSGRWKIWKETFDMICEKPGLGYGPDNLKSEYTLREIKIDRAHNEPLERAVSTGVSSAIFYVSAILLAVISALKNKKTGADSVLFLVPLMAVCTYFVSSMVGVFLFYTACHMFIMLGLVEPTNKEL